ncbi:hypothetical protein [Nocardia sp. NPDC050710]|uniref:hypothetical protein n=1 Tax=Nocardia sp. NPDC050710 TaxID=3157220 RepID=UPI0033CD7E73
MDRPRDLDLTPGRRATDELDDRGAMAAASSRAAPTSPTLATALGMEIALLRINAGLDRTTIADQLGIPGGRYCDIENASKHDTCVTVADLGAIAALHHTTITAIHQAALDRIARGDLPTGSERAARAWELALGSDTDSYFTNHAPQP